MLFRQKTCEHLIQTKQSKALISLAQELFPDVQKLAQLCGEQGANRNKRGNYLISILVLSNPYCCKQTPGSKICVAIKLLRYIMTQHLIKWLNIRSPDCMHATYSYTVRLKSRDGINMNE